MSFSSTSQAKQTLKTPDHLDRSQSCRLSIKTLEKVVAMDLDQNAFKENPLHEDQFGFVKGRSTEHALSATVNEIEKGLHEK
jgi:hypothetical protein